VGGGALHCFCPRAPKTLVTPLPFIQETRVSRYQENVHSLTFTHSQPVFVAIIHHL